MFLNWRVRGFFHNQICALDRSLAFQEECDIKVTSLSPAQTPQPLLDLLCSGFLSSIPVANYTLTAFVFFIDVSFKPIKVGRDFR